MRTKITTQKRYHLKNREVGTMTQTAQERLKEIEIGLMHKCFPVGGSILCKSCLMLEAEKKGILLGLKSKRIRFCEACQSNVDAGLWCLDCFRQRENETHLSTLKEVVLLLSVFDEHKEAKKLIELTWKEELSSLQTQTHGTRTEFGATRSTHGSAEREILDTEMQKNQEVRIGEEVALKLLPEENPQGLLPSQEGQKKKQ